MSRGKSVIDVVFSDIFDLIVVALKCLVGSVRIGWHV
jgi:hypothetical protein